MNLRTHRDLLATSAVVGALAYWRLWLWEPARRLNTVDTWLYLPADPLPQSIFLIAAILVYRRRESLRSAMQASGSPALAALPLLAGSLLFLWGHYVDAMDLLLVSFLLVSTGAGLLWFGTRFVRALAIPWVVLAFAIPVPATLSNQAFYFLRLWAAEQTTVLLPIVGFPVFRHGNMIYGNNIITQVIDTCSGLRSMEMLALAAILYVGWYPVRRARGVLLVVLAPAIAYAFNVVRVAVIAVFPTSEFSRSHSMQGMAVFLGAVFGLVLLDRLLARLFPTASKVCRAPSGPEAENEHANEVRESTTGSSGAADPSPGPCAVALAALLVILFGVSIGMPQWDPTGKISGGGRSLPSEIDGWTREQTLTFDRGYLWTVAYTKHEYRRYERDGEELSVFIGHDNRKYRNRSLLSPKNAVPGRGWEVVERGSVALGSGGPRVQRVIAQSISGRSLSYSWYEGIDGLADETVRQLLAMDQSRFRRPQPARVIRVTIELGPDSPDQSREEDELRTFASSLAVALRN